MQRSQDGSFCLSEAIAEFKALYYWCLREAACKINQQIAL